MNVPVGIQHSLWNGEEKKEDIVYFCCDRRKPRIFSIPRKLSGLSLIASLCLFPNPSLQIDPKGLLPLESSRYSSSYSLKSPTQTLIFLLMLLIKISPYLACHNHTHPYSALLPSLWNSFSSGFSHLHEWKIGLPSTSFYPVLQQHQLWAALSEWIEIKIKVIVHEQKSHQTQILQKAQTWKFALNKEKGKY